MLHRLIALMVFPGFLVMLIACEPEQEGTPPESQEARQQEEPAPVENDGAAERDDGELHVGRGSIVSIDPSRQQLTINHGRVESLGWPEMTMPFKVVGPDLLEGIGPDMNVEFVFYEAPEGNYVIAEMRNLDEER